MQNPILVTFRAIKRVMSKRAYVIAAVVISIVFLVILIAIPVLSIPGNDVAFQLTVFSWIDYVVMTSLALLTGLMAAMQAFAFKLKKSVKQASGIFGIFPGFVAGLFGSAGCATCVAAIFGFLGTGTILFLLVNRWYVVAISVILVGSAIFLSSLSIERKCNC